MLETFSCFYIGHLVLFEYIDVVDRWWKRQTARLEGEFPMSEEQLEFFCLVDQQKRGYQDQVDYLNALHVDQIPVEIDCKSWNSGSSALLMNRVHAALERRGLKKLGATPACGASGRRLFHILAV